MRNLIVFLFLSVGCAESGTFEHRHTVEAKGFSIEVPESWTAQDTTFSIACRMYVFLVARNAEAALVTPHIPMRPSNPGRIKPVMEHLEEQVPKGGIVLYLYHFEGGPPPWCNFAPDTVGDNLAAVVDTLSPKRSERGTWHFGVRKWNCGWSAIVLENRASRADHKAARRLLGSLEFASKPVVRQGQASSLAHELLADVMGDSLPEFLNVDVKEEHDVFLVTFRDCKGCQEEAPREREWQFRVDRAGIVESVGSR